MNKKDMAKAVASRANFEVTEAQVTEILDIASSLFREELKNLEPGKDGRRGDRAKFWDLFIGELAQRNARTGINPKTKEKIQIEAKVVVKLKPTSIVNKTIE